uniref:Anthranilate synthase alpha subunit n=1 Tax=Vitis labrusca TaxID=103355 RepID=A0A1U9YG92_VITLA|nr:anthranilate synthase alpha subunit [Vitis labrusca]
METLAASHRLLPANRRFDAAPTCGNSNCRATNVVFGNGRGLNGVSDNGRALTSGSLALVSSGRRWHAVACLSHSSPSLGNCVGFNWCDPVFAVDHSAKFFEAAKKGNLIPLHRSIFSDHLTPVLAYRCLVKEDDRDAPSFLYESVEPGIQSSNVQVFVIHWVRLDQYSSVEEAFNDGMNRLEALVSRVHDIVPPKLAAGSIKLQTGLFGPSLEKSTMTCDEYMKAVLEAKEHILAGDIFQIVLSQRFERRTFADPFEVYRALRIVNPSPYMTYLQARGCILVASSPEILTRVKKNRIINRPLAGTVRRGKTPKEDIMLENQLRNDEKQCAEHIMLVDLGRNDVGKVSKPGSVTVEKLMNIERYSHVMHISSTVTGELLDHLTSWDALRAALPVGTVSGAPKVKAMELIDQLEVTRRGPYSGGFGGISFSGDMDIALALRTIVFPSGSRFDTMFSYKDMNKRREWVAHLQAGAGIVADSVPADEQRECENKAAALARAIDLAESSFIEK